MRKHFSKALGEQGSQDDAPVAGNVEVAVELNAETLSKFTFTYGEPGSGKCRVPEFAEHRLQGRLSRVFGRHSLLRRTADVISFDERRDPLVRWFLRQFPLTRRKYRDNDAWEAARHMLMLTGMAGGGDLDNVDFLVRQVLATMKRPTIGELIRVLATDDYSSFRRQAADECARTLREHPLHERRFVKVQFDDYLGVLRGLALGDRVPTMPDRGDRMDQSAEEAADRMKAAGLAMLAWLADLANMAEAEVQARWDAALPPPAPATASTRGRF